VVLTLKHAETKKNNYLNNIQRLFNHRKTVTSSRTKSTYCV